MGDPMGRPLRFYMIPLAMRERVAAGRVRGEG